MSTQFMRTGTESMQHYRYMKGDGYGTRFVY
jgi:hypothetical protein